MTAHFQIPLNLPHAGKVALRILRLVERRARDDESSAALDTARRLEDLLASSRVSGEPPPMADTDRVREEAASLCRVLVEQIESEGIGGNTLGQNVRNLFECLERGEEGAALSLRAGESPNSLQRPV